MTVIQPGGVGEGVVEVAADLVELARRAVERRGVEPGRARAAPAGAGRAAASRAIVRALGVQPRR